MVGIRVDGIGYDDKKIKRSEIRFNNFNNFYQQLKTGQPIIGNILNGTASATTETSQASAQL